MENIREFAETIKGIQMSQVIDIGIAILIYILFRCLSKSLAYMTVRIFKPKTKNKKEIRKNAFYAPLKVFYVVLGIYLALLFIRKPLNTGVWINSKIDELFKIAIIILSANGIANSLTTNSSLVNRLKDKMNPEVEDSMLRFILKAIRVIIYIIAGFIIITDLGVNLNGLVAGLGLGSVVITLAAQDTAKNLFGGLVIFLDKPFVVGDWIEVEKYESISKAAQHLYINQPRLSKIIKEIEEEANIKIFERHNKGVVPTTKGREFLSQAKKIVQEVDYLKNMYQDDPHKLNLDICVPRSSYISEAFIEYLKMDNNMKKKLNLNYRETNSIDTIQNVYDGENNLGIVRFPLRDQDYYFNILNLKELTYEKLFTFDYQILISKDNPLKDKDIYMKDLKKQIELKHGDIHIQEDHHNHKHMNIYERGIQFELLNEIPETYMWVAPMPKKLLKQNDFVLKTCKDKKIPYVDYLIYRKGYVLSKEDQNFIECLKNVIEQVK